MNTITAALLTTLVANILRAHGTHAARITALAEVFASATLPQVAHFAAFCAANDGALIGADSAMAIQGAAYQVATDCEARAIACVEGGRARGRHAARAEAMDSIMGAFFEGGA